MRTSKGYSIVEVIIVLLIISVFLGIGVIGHRDFTQRQEVTVVKREIVGDLRLAQASAQTGKKPEGCTNPLDGYRFELTNYPNSANYEVIPVCGGADYSPVKSVTLASDILISPTRDRLLFKPLALGTDLPSGASMTITIRKENISFSETIVITSIGEIR